MGRSSPQSADKRERERRKRRKRKDKLERRQRRQDEKRRAADGPGAGALAGVLRPAVRWGDEAERYERLVWFPLPPAP